MIKCKECGSTQKSPRDTFCQVCGLSYEGGEIQQQSIVWVILGTVLGGLAILAGFATLFTMPIHGVAYLFVGAVIFPPSIKRIENFTGIYLSPKAKTIVVLVFLCLPVIIEDKEEITPNKMNLINDISAKPRIVESQKPNYDFTYRKTENQYGVTFYYFNQEKGPILNATENYESLDVHQINVILEKINLPPIMDNQKYSKGGKKIFSIADYPLGDLVVSLRKCSTPEQTEYSCIEKLYISPDSITKLQNQAKNYPDKFIFISHEQYGNDWPFTVEAGLISCKRYRDVVFIADHKIYGLNGKAMGNKSYEDIWDIKRDSPKHPGVKMTIADDMIPKGLSLCPK